MKRILFALLVICLLPSVVVASEFEDSIPYYSNELLSELTDNADFAQMIKAVIDGEFELSSSFVGKLVNMVAGDVRGCFAYTLSIMGIAILSSCIKGSQITLNGVSSDISFMVCYFVASGFLIGLLRIATQIAFDASQEVVTFTKMSLPAYIGIVTSCGINAAASRGVFLMMVNVVSEYAGGFMINAFFFIGILTVISNMSTEIHITKLINIAKQVLLWGLGFLLTLFAGMTALSGLNASVSSTAGIRAVKYTIGHAIPVVGGFLADSTELILASAKIFKNAFGTVGIIVLAIICLVPVVKLFVIGFVMKITAGLCEPFCHKLMCDTIYNIGQCVIYIMVAVLLMTVMFVMAFAVLLNL